MIDFINRVPDRYPVFYYNFNISLDKKPEGGNLLHVRVHGVGDKGYSRYIRLDERDLVTGKYIKTLKHFIKDSKAAAVFETSGTPKEDANMVLAALIAVVELAKERADTYNLKAVEQLREITRVIRLTGDGHLIEGLFVFRVEGIAWHNIKDIDERKTGYRWDINKIFDEKLYDMYNMLVKGGKK